MRMMKNQITVATLMNHNLLQNDIIGPFTKDIQAQGVEGEIRQTCT